jgi:hypothetical protein
MLAAVRTLRIDFKTKLLFAPLTVTFAPAVKSLDTPWVVIFTGPRAEIAAVVVTVELVEIIETPPPVELSVAVELVIAPVPEREMLPVAVMAPVGATVLPPLIETPPLVASRVPAPE